MPDPLGHSLRYACSLKHSTLTTRKGAPGDSAYFRATSGASERSRPLGLSGPCAPWRAPSRARGHPSCLPGGRERLQPGSSGEVSREPCRCYGRPSRMRSATRVAAHGGVSLVVRPWIVDPVRGVQFPYAAQHEPPDRAASSFPIGLGPTPLLACRPWAGKTKALVRPATSTIACSGKPSSAPVRPKAG